MKNWFFAYLLAIYVSLISNVYSFMYIRCVKLDDDVIPSPYLLNYSSKYSAQNYTEKDISTSHINFTNVMNVTQNYSIELPQYLNARNEVLEYKIDKIKKDFTRLDEAEYDVKYIYDQKLVRAQKGTNEVEGVKKVNVQVQEPIIESSVFNSFQGLSFNLKIAFGNVLFGISKEGKLVVYQYNGAFFERIKLSSYFNGTDTWNIEEQSIKNILLDSNQGDNPRHLLIIHKNNTAFVYRLFMDRNPRHFGVYLTQVRTLFALDNYVNNDTHKVIKFIYKNGMFYVFINISEQTDNNTQDEYGYYSKHDRSEVLVYESGQKTTHYSTFYSQKYNKDLTMLIKDAQEVGEFIYVLVENYGIKMFSTRINGIPHWEDYEFYHPYIEQMFVQQNPYFAYDFVGILVNFSYKKNNDDDNLGNEFFFEMSAEDPSHPTLYRTYLAKSAFNIKYALYDNRYTYLFEHKTNSMYVLARTSAATDNSVFKVSFASVLGSTEITERPLFISMESGYKILGVQSKTDLVLMRQVKTLNAQVNLEFMEGGEYQVDITAYSDKCHQNEYVKSVEKCFFKLSYYFSVTGSSDFKFLSYSVSKTVTYMFLGVTMAFVFGLCFFYFLPVIRKKLSSRYSFNPDEGTEMKSNEVKPAKIAETEGGIPGSKINFSTKNIGDEMVITIER